MEKETKKLIRTIQDDGRGLMRVSVPAELKRKGWKPKDKVEWLITDKVEVRKVEERD